MESEYTQRSNTCEDTGPGRLWTFAIISPAENSKLKSITIQGYVPFSASVTCCVQVSRHSPQAAAGDNRGALW